VFLLDTLCICLPENFDCGSAAVNVLSTLTVTSTFAMHSIDKNFNCFSGVGTLVDGKKY